MTRHVPALVVGGGISGLVCAYALRKTGVAAEIVEASSRPGGVIQSVHGEGFLLELGPQSFSTAASVMDLFHELDLDDQIVLAPRSPRFVLIDGALQPVPLSPPAFLKSSFVGVKTKLTIARDLLGRSAPPATEESVAAFVRRKFTPELLEKLVGPFISGIYAGDPEQLSLRTSFPQLYDAETQTGSIVRGLARLGKQLKQTGEPPRNIFTLRDGNETLIHALCSRVGPAVRTKTRVTSIARREDSSFDVQLESNGQAETVSTKFLILATPTEVTGRLLASLDSRFESLLRGVDYVPVAVVSLGYHTKDIGHSLDGFGFLVPRSAGVRVLGTVWNSSLFPGRAPEGHALLTSFLGGATDPAVAGLDPGEIATIAHDQISRILSITGEPAFSSVTIWNRALPQYNVGHMDRVAAVAKLFQNHPGIWLTGNYLRGPALGSCIEQSTAVAQEVCTALKS